MADKEAIRKKKDSAYRKVVRKTWRKQNFRSLPDDLKMLLLYLWTGPDASNPGIYYISLGTIADDLETVTETVRERLGILFRNDWINYDFDARVVFLPKWDKFDPPENGNVCKSFIAHVAELPDTKLSGYFLTTLKPYCERFHIPLDERLCIPLPEPNANGIAIQEQEQEQEHKQGEPQKTELHTIQTTPSAPTVILDKETREKMLGEISTAFGLNRQSKKELCFGDYMLAIRDWLSGVYPTADPNALKVVAGNITKAIARNAFGKVEQYQKDWPPIIAFTEFLNHAIGQPSEQGGLLAGRKYPPKPTDMIRFVNQVFTDGQQTHEYAHAAYCKAGLV